MTSLSSFQYHSRSKFELPYLSSNLAEIWHRGQFRGTDVDFSLNNPISLRFEQEKGCCSFTKN